jgi:hypothetical protein
MSAGTSDPWLSVQQLVPRLAGCAGPGRSRAARVDVQRLEHDEVQGALEHSPLECHVAPLDALRGARRLPCPRLPPAVGRSYARQWPHARHGRRRASDAPMTYSGATAAVFALARRRAAAVADPGGSAARLSLDPDYPVAAWPPARTARAIRHRHDGRGLIHLGNLSGVVIHDGAGGACLPVGKARSGVPRYGHRALGRVGVGGVDDLGYVGAGRDRHAAVRLAAALPALGNSRTFGQVPARRAHRGRLRISHGARASRLERKPDDHGRHVPRRSPVRLVFSVGRATVRLDARSGIVRPRGTTPEPVPGGEVFRGRPRVDLLLADAPRSRWYPCAPRACSSVRRPRRPRSLPKHRAGRPPASVTCGSRLPDGRIALGSRPRRPSCSCGPDGSMDQRIDTRPGCRTTTSRESRATPRDRSGLSLDNGLARWRSRHPSPCSTRARA